MKNYQETLEITDEDITRIEQPILTREEAKYQEKLKEEKLKREGQQEAERAKQLELQEQREREKQEEKLRQQELEYQQRLQQYEQKVSNSIRQGLSPSHIRRELRQLQQTLRLKDSDVSSIEIRLVSRRSSASKIPSSSQGKPSQAGILSLEEKLRQQGTDYQRRLQQYEQKVSNAISQGISPSHIRRELRQLQKTLGLKDSDVSSIETRHGSRKSSASIIPPLLIWSGSFFVCYFLEIVVYFDGALMSLWFLGLIIYFIFIFIRRLRRLN